MSPTSFRPEENAAAAACQPGLDGKGRLIVALLASMLMLAITSVGMLVWLWHDTPDVRAVAERVSNRPSQIVSSDGVLLGTIGLNQSAPVDLQQVSPFVVDALLATEDKRFYEHGAVDMRRMVASAASTLQGDLQGASTLTQQLARNLFPKKIGNDRSVMRKLREIIVAFKIEGAYTKQQILALYLNQVPYLYDVVGIEMAARTYFDKPASELAVQEAALLVAMLKGPNYFDPERRPERALARRNLVLRLMAAEGHLDAAALAQARAEPLGVVLTRHDIDAPLAPHYLRLVKTQIGNWAAQQGLDAQRDGLTIRVSLDSKLQQLAEQAVERQGNLLQSVAENEWKSAALQVGPPAKPVGAKAFAHFWQRNPALMFELASQTPAFKTAMTAGASEAQALQAAATDPALADLREAKTRIEAGFIAIDPRDGQVRAYVGSRGWADDRFDHVSQAQRQPGSTFKPFVYGAALAAGFAQNQMFLDAPVTMALADGKTWTPGDIGGSSGRAMMMRTGLSRSKNTITAQVMQQIGAAEVVRYARALGVDRSALDPVPSLALGTSPVTLIEMAGAYSTLAALGVRREPVLIDQIETRDGRVLARFDSRPVRVLQPEQAAVMVDILREAVDSGTGTMLRSQFGLKADIAGKTGTTQRNTDGWFLSLQPTLVTGAWVGFNDQRVTMRSNQWGQGGHSALRLVGDFLREGSKLELLDMESRFPEVQRPAPPMVWPPQPDEYEYENDWIEADASEHNELQQDWEAQPSSPYIVVRNGNEQPIDTYRRPARSTDKFDIVRVSTFDQPRTASDQPPIMWP